jgi:hypothetical protein
MRNKNELVACDHMCPVGLESRDFDSAHFSPSPSHSNLHLLLHGRATTTLLLPLLLPLPLTPTGAGPALHLPLNPTNPHGLQRCLLPALRQLAVHRHLAHLLIRVH